MFSTKNILKLAGKEFIWGGHLQCFGAISIVFVSSVLLGLSLSWDILFVGYLAFYPIYLYNRYKEINSDYLTNKERTEHLKTYLSKIPTILFWVILIMFLSLVYFRGILPLIFVGIIFLLGVLYTTVFKKLTKYIPLFKNLYVSAFFSLMVFFPFIYYSYYPESVSTITAAVVLFVFVYLKTMSMQAFLDVKDIETDGKEGLITFPILMGRDRALKFITIFDVVVSVLVPVLAYLYSVFTVLVLFLIPVLFLNLYCILLVQKNKYYGFIIEAGEFIFWGILIYLGQIII